MSQFCLGRCQCSRPGSILVLNHYSPGGFCYKFDQVVFVVRTVSIMFFVQFISGSCISFPFDLETVSFADVTTGENTILKQRKQEIINTFVIL